jgi:hypothetical protein
MSNMTRLLATISGLLVALGTLVGTVSLTLGKGPEPASGGVVVILQSPEQYAEFFRNHPSNG